MTSSCSAAVPCWRSNLSHQPHASPKSGPALTVLTACSNHSRAFSILRLPNAAEQQYNQIAIDQIMPDVGHSCSGRGSNFNAFLWAGAPDCSSKPCRETVFLLHVHRNGRNVALD